MEVLLEECEVVVLFIDIVGYMLLLEGLIVGEIVEFINYYLLLVGV